MKVVDANVLLYATNRRAERHHTAAAWLDAALSRNEPVGFAWLVLVAFVRVSTQHAAQPRPLNVDAAAGIADLWVTRPNAVLLEPQPGHLARVRDLLAPTGTGGSLVNDAHIAALALEHGATVVSYDNDFARFPGVRWRTPDQLLDD